MKIRIPLTIEIDPKSWVDSGLGGGIADADDAVSATAVRDDIRTYVLNLVQQSAMVDEADADVTL